MYVIGGNDPLTIGVGVIGVPIMGHALCGESGKGKCIGLALVGGNGGGMQRKGLYLVD
jgi:hypothetical protein